MLAALAACVALTPTARAQFHMSYEDTTTGHAIGEAFAGGGFRINLANFDNGVLYSNLGAGNSAGFGAGGSGTQTVSGGISTLDALAQTPATGAVAQPTVINGVAQPASVGSEDGWGIARIISITDLGGAVIWSETNKNAQLTIMFYGLKDFYVNQTTSTKQTIDGVGMHVDLYYQSKSDGAYTQYDPLLGSGGRAGASGYTTVTDGENILSVVSTPGFINDAGTLGGVATEFQSEFNATSGGQGEMYMSIVGGTRASEFDNDDFISPYIPGQTADLFGQFTTAINTQTADWLARSNDPIVGSFQPVPEPSTYGLAGAALLSGIVAFRRRMQKRAVAS